MGSIGEVTAPFSRGALHVAPIDSKTHRASGKKVECQAGGKGSLYRLALQEKSIDQSPTVVRGHPLTQGARGRGALLEALRESEECV